MVSLRNFALVACASAVLFACSSNDNDDPPPPPPPPLTPASVPVITVQPATSIIAEGTAVALSVTATGNGTLTYSWRRNETVVVGATSATYNLPAITGAQAGDYDCIVTNSLNSTSASTTSAVGRLIVVETPVITQTVASSEELVGKELHFDYRATSNGQNTYVLRRDGTLVTSSGSPGYFIFGVKESDAGLYELSITSTLLGVTSAAVTSSWTMTVLGQSASTVTAEPTLIANSTGHVASVPARTGATFAWSIVNGTITAGQGTRQITYTAGQVGASRVGATVTSTAGSVFGVKNQTVVNALPVAGIFAQPVVHPGDVDVRASAAVSPGNTYAWTSQNLGATVVTPGGATAQTFTYGVGTSVGQYLLEANVSDGAGNSALVTRTLDVSSNVFLKDKRENTPRTLHTATRMDDGRVLVVGGVPSRAPDLSRVFGTAEIYDPVTQRWADVASIGARSSHSATLLNDGRVLVIGGLSAPNTYLATGSLYDPVTRTWTAAGSLLTARAFHEATKLTDGRVLVTGGMNGSGTLASSEIFNPAGNSWSATGDLLAARRNHSATLMADGRVLAAAGRNGANADLATAEIFNPASGTWSAVASMSSARSGAGAVLLPTGIVVQLGGGVELYDPAANTWTLLRDQDTFPPGGAPISFGGRRPALLANGTISSGLGRLDVAGRRVIPSAEDHYSLGSDSVSAHLADDSFVIVGGSQGSFDGLPTNASLVSSSGDSVVALGALAHSGENALAATMNDGRILFAGGNSRDTPTTIRGITGATLFNPATKIWTSLPSMSRSREFTDAVTLANGRVLVAGGVDGNPAMNVISSAEFYDPVANTWSSAGLLSGPRYRLTVTALANGGALAVGGKNLTSCNCTTFQSSVDLYTPGTNSWAPANPLLTARDSHTATTLSDGRILVTGGYGGTPSTLADTGALLASSELYDPATGNWTATGAMSAPRRDHIAISLGGGRVLVAGGTNGTTTYASAEIYDVATGLWTPAASMNTARQSASVGMLSDGKVLVVNGLNGASSLTFGVGTGEVYDPVANTWSPAVTTAVPRVGSRAVSLADGRVMIVGGWPNAAGTPEFYR